MATCPLCHQGALRLTAEYRKFKSPFAAMPPEARPPPRGHPAGAPVREPAPGLCVWWRHIGGGAHYACGSVCPSAV
jgi:hypothetical protein